MSGQIRREPWSHKPYCLPQVADTHRLCVSGFAVAPSVSPRMPTAEVAEARSDAYAVLRVLQVLPGSLYHPADARNESWPCGSSLALAGIGAWRCNPITRWRWEMIGTSSQGDGTYLRNLPQTPPSTSSAAAATAGSAISAKSAGLLGGYMGRKMNGSGSSESSVWPNMWTYEHNSPGRKGSRALASCVAL